MAPLRLCAPLHHEPTPRLQWIESASSFQIPAFHIVGLPGPEVAEARERIRAAIEASGLEFPRRRILLNLSPASIRKQGTGADLAMALALLDCHSHSGSAGSAPRFWSAWGELGLDGQIKPVGQLTRALYACWENSVPDLILSSEELEPARKAARLLESAKCFPKNPFPRIHGATHLAQAWHLIQGRQRESGLNSAFPSPFPSPSPSPSLSPSPAGADSPSARGNPSLLPISPYLLRLLCLSLSGRHHLLLLGPRGCGKSQAMEWLQALLPDPPLEAELAHRLLRELSGSSSSRPGDRSGPRRVSATVRPAALTGGVQMSGAVIPGEFSLAHGTVLLADEFPEWSHDSREALREPLERGVVTLTRLKGSVELPAAFLFAGTGNLCPCGGLPTELASSETRDRCQCTWSRRRNYALRLSGPILDRIDLTLVIQGPLSPRGATQENGELQSCRDRIQETRHGLISRYGTLPGDLPAARLDELLRSRPDWQRILDSQPDLTLRGRHKALRVALTISAWEKKTEPTAEHFFEASSLHGRLPA